MNDIIDNIIMNIENFDYNNISMLFSFLLVYYVSKRTIRNYDLKKDSKPKNIKEIALPPEVKLKYDEVAFNSMMSSKAKEAVLKFTNLMIEKFPSEVLSNFYNNINTLEIKNNAPRKNQFFNNFRCVGVYKGELNRIILDENQFFNTIYHELFHMASSVSKDKIYYSGFYQAKPKSMIGEGINEGYTEVLTKRYFYQDTRKFKSYEFLVMIADRLEKIIGKDIMESLYFKADLHGLVLELQKYISEDDVMKFITNTDFILKYVYEDRVRFIERDKIVNVLKTTINLLIKAYNFKLESEYSKGNIRADEFLEEMYGYCSSFASDLKIDGHNYKFLSSEDFVDIFTLYFKDLLDMKESELIIKK